MAISTSVPFTLEVLPAEPPKKPVTAPAWEPLMPPEPEVTPEPAVADELLPVVTPAAQKVIQGAAATFEVTFTQPGEFAGELELDVADPPVGAVVTFDCNPVAVGDSATLTIATAQVAAGVYKLTLTADEID